MIGLFVNTLSALSCIILEYSYKRKPFICISSYRNSKKRLCPGSCITQPFVRVSCTNGTLPVSNPPYCTSDYNTYSISYRIMLTKRGGVEGEVEITSTRLATGLSLFSRELTAKGGTR